MLESFSKRAVELIETAKNLVQINNETNNEELVTTFYLLLSMYNANDTICHFLLNELEIEYNDLIEEYKKEEVIEQIYYETPYIPGEYTLVNGVYSNVPDLTGYEEKYSSLLEKGRNENKMTCHKYAKQNEKTLLNRMDKYSHNHLLFLHDLSVPFDDNISERDLRKVKNRQKMSGGFRKESGNGMYCSIMTIIETLKKRKMGIIENLRKLFMGTPAIF